MDLKKNNKFDKEYNAAIDEFNCEIPCIPSTVILPFGASDFQKAFWNKMIRQPNKQFLFKVNGMWL